MIEFIQNFKQKIIDAFHTDSLLSSLVKNCYFTPQINEAYPYVMIGNITVEKNILNIGMRYMLYFDANIFANNDDLTSVYKIYDKITQLFNSNLFGDEYYLINCFAGKYVESPGHDLNSIKITTNYQLILQDVNSN